MYKNPVNNGIYYQTHFLQQTLPPFLAEKLVEVVEVDVTLLVVVLVCVLEVVVKVMVDDVDVVLATSKKLHLLKASTYWGFFATSPMMNDHK